MKSSNDVCRISYPQYNNLESERQIPWCETALCECHGAIEDVADEGGPYSRKCTCVCVQLLAKQKGGAEEWRGGIAQKVAKGKVRAKERQMWEGRCDGVISHWPAANIATASAVWRSTEQCTHTQAGQIFTYFGAGPTFGGFPPRGQTAMPSSLSGQVCGHHRHQRGLLRRQPTVALYRAHMRTALLHRSYRRSYIRILAAYSATKSFLISSSSKIAYSSSRWTFDSVGAPSRVFFCNRTF